MQYFTIEHGNWYAAVGYGEGWHSKPTPSGHVVSPIRVNRFTPLKSGSGTFELECAHLFAADDISTDVFMLKTVHRSRQGLWAVQVENDECTIFISPLTQAWLQFHFPHAAPANENAGRWLEVKYEENVRELSQTLHDAAERLSNIPRVSAHWGSDRLWQNAYRLLEQIQDQRLIALDLRQIQESIFAADSIAYQLMDGMVSVKEHEGWEGYKGAPRLLLLALAVLWHESQGGSVDRHT